MATYIADRYRVKKKDIGSGNMASIHLCEDTDADDEEKDSTVIIKMFDKPKIGDEDLQKQLFNREVDALENAQDSVVIVSPWIKAGGLNHEILGHIEKALQRKTQVVIGYGISEKEDNDKWILDRLSNIQKKRHGQYLKIVRLSNTHEKVLIKDSEFMVITSFNWLSFKGDPDKGFRQETGYYTESKGAIAQIKANLSQRLGIEL